MCGPEDRCPQRRIPSLAPSMRPQIQRHACALAVLLLLPMSSPWSSSAELLLSDVKPCSDVDELPAFPPDEKWATLFEVISPYASLCMVPVPEGYTERPAWPKCLWELPKSNIPKAALWDSGHIKSAQSWLKLSGDKVQLPRAGGSLAANKFLQFLPPSIDMKAIRTVLDEGAGVCGLAAEIMVTYKHRPLVVSYAPHDSHTNQVQLCMERGVPAIIFNMARYQFPAPPSSFDMVTCKWCWHWISAVSMGQWFLEVDRVLRPGGYFVIYASVWQNLNFKDQVDFWAAAVGWTKILNVKSKDMAAYQKPHEALLPTVVPALGYAVCPPAEYEQPSFRRFHVPCRYPAPQSQLAQLPAVEPELAYVTRLLALMRGSSAFINVLDANAGSGSFGEAVRLLLANAWTLNIQPVKAVEFHHKPGASAVNFAGISNFVTSIGPDRLPTVFSRGGVGLYHDWCYMFPSYPRAFDLIHVRGVALPHENCLVQAVLEIDRLLRPGGYVVLSGDGVAQAVTEASVQPLGWVKLERSGGDLGGGQGEVLVMRKLGGTFLVAE